MTDTLWAALARILFWRRLCTLPPVHGSWRSSPKVEIWRHARRGHLETVFHLTDADTGSRRAFRTQDIPDLVAQWHCFLSMVEADSLRLRVDTIADWLLSRTLAVSDQVKDGAGRSVGTLV
jgi:hypothetical protein